jgi:hypothetical protein
LLCSTATLERDFFAVKAIILHLEVFASISPPTSLFPKLVANSLQSINAVTSSFFILIDYAK